MNKEMSQKLVSHLVSKAHEEGVFLGKTKLMKLLYLIDVEYYRHYHLLLTEADWEFFLYGPYDRMLSEVIDNTPGVEAVLIERDDGKDYFKYKAKERMAEYIVLEPGILGIADQVYEEWADKDLRVVLDYVYFETEPMISATSRGEKLDFTCIRPPEAYEVKEIVITEDTKLRFRQKLAEWKAKHGAA